MPRAIAKEERKSRSVGIRLTENEYLGLEYLAKQEKVTTSQMARDLLFAGLEALQDDAEEKMPLSAQHSPVELVSQIVEQLTPLQQLPERDRDIGRQLRKLQRSVDALAFMYLFHTPAITDEYKQEAVRHATVTYKKFDELRGVAYGTLPNARADTAEDS